MTSGIPKTSSSNNNKIEDFKATFYSAPEVTAYSFVK